MHVQCQIHKKHHVATQRQLRRPLHFSNQSFRLDRVCILNVNNTFLTALGPSILSTQKMLNLLTSKIQHVYIILYMFLIFFKYS
jgi:hypothetical protein